MTTTLRLVSAILLLAPVLFSGCAGSAKLRREADLVVERVASPDGKPRVRDLQSVCWQLSQRGLRYSFGSCRPENGGLDCSGTVHYVLSSIGYQRVPRMSNHQYYWLKKEGNLRKASDLDAGVLRRLRPGDLLFWEGTYKTGRRYPPKISHVMIYMGKDKKSGVHWMFGGRGSGKKGRNGAGIDFYTLKEGTGEGRRSSFSGYGRIPGLKR